MSNLGFPIHPVFIVDDEKNALDIMESMLLSEGINNIITSRDSRDVMEILSRERIEVILLDLTMPHISGEELIPGIRQYYPDIPIIIVTGASEISTAVNCMKMGVFDYLVKAVEKSKLAASVRKAIEIRELKRENNSLKERFLSQKLEHREVFASIVTNNDKMKSIFIYLESIAGTAQTVLITGETGTGKELVARAIHRLSGREDVYIPLNVAGFDDSMFSDSLFGHKKGAYTGANESRKGLFEEAYGGTIFLDEIGDVSVSSQVKLLRLIETGEYFPLGSGVTKKSNARVIVATNRDLPELVDSGKFRKDLYYRLCVHHIHLHPLRERMDDLPLLVNHFLEEAAGEFGKKKPTPPQELYALLGTYNFPGNVRELRSMIFDAVSKHTSGILSMEGFESLLGIKFDSESKSEMQYSQRKSPVIFTERLPTLKQNSELLIDEALKRAKGNQSIAAKLIGITPQAINRRLKIRDKRF